MEIFLNTVFKLVGFTRFRRLTKNLKKIWVTY